MVKSTILVDTYVKQINIVNFQDNKVKASLTFSQI
ncbi:DUF6702 family protein [Colwellia sp. RSH04]